MKRPCAVLWLLALGACAPTPAPTDRPAFQPDAEGIQIYGTPPRIDFGRTEEGVVVAVSRLVGREPTSTPDCPDGRLTEVSWSTGLTLAFRNRAFVGWKLAEGGSAGDVCPG